MKKVFVWVVAIMMLLALAACGENPVDTSNTATNGTSEPTTTNNPTKPDEKVTIYIPDEVIAADPTGMQLTLQYVFEDGWQDKESFSATCGICDENGLSAVISTVTYSERLTVMEIAGTNRTETVLDENGRAIAQTMTYLREDVELEKTETVSTYDEFGRILAQETTRYYSNELGSVETMVDCYTYTETDTGSEGRMQDGGIVYVRIYDKNYRCVRSITILNGEEAVRTDSEYDEVGNLIKSISYSYGEKTQEIYYTWKAVEVSAEFAERMPQFKVKK